MNTYPSSPVTRKKGGAAANAGAGAGTGAGAGASTAAGASGGDASASANANANANANASGSGHAHTHQTPGNAPLLGTGSINMELAHDFGEGVGVDMRDFTDVKDDLVDEMSTPQLHHSLSSQPPTSLITNHGMPSGPGAGQPRVVVDDMFQAETGLDEEDEDDDGDNDGPKKRSKNSDVPGGFTYVDKDGDGGRRKIRIEYITDKSRRHITFSKRKAGIMKKAYELSILTGTQVLLLVVSETGLVYTFTTTKLQPLVQKAEGKNLIQACLNAPDGFGPDGQPLSGSVSSTKAKNGGLAIRPHKLTAAASAALAASAQAAGQQAAEAGIVMDQSGDSQQTDAATTVGLGTPTSRPKKRLASGKRKNADSITESPMQAENIPPVPHIPDMHRQHSPHNLNMALQSPISTNYPYPHHHPDYHQQQQQHAHHPHQHHQHPHHHVPSPTGATFYPPPGPDYGAYAGYPPPQHAGYLALSPAGLQSPYGAPGGTPHSPHQTHLR